MLVLGVSQSGQSEDIVEVVAEAKRQGALTAAITADPRSPLAAAAGRTLGFKTGAEKAVAATKTFTVLSGAHCSPFRRHEKAAGSGLLPVRGLPDFAASTIKAASRPAAERAERYRYMQRCVVISRGFCYGIAMEVALKLKELTYVTAEPYSSADFLHGPMAMLEPGFPVILVAPAGTLLPHMNEFAAAALGREAEIIAISDSQEMLAMGITQAAFHARGPGVARPDPCRHPGPAPGPTAGACKGVRPGCSTRPAQGHGDPLRLPCARIGSALDVFLDVKEEDPALGFNGELPERRIENGQDLPHERLLDGPLAEDLLRGVAGRRRCRRRSRPSSAPGGSPWLPCEGWGRR